MGDGLTPEIERVGHVSDTELLPKSKPEASWPSVQSSPQFVSGMIHEQLCTDAAPSVIALFRLAQIAIPHRVRQTAPPTAPHKRQSRHKRRGRPRRSATSI